MDDIGDEAMLVKRLIVSLSAPFEHVFPSLDIHLKTIVKELL